MEIFAPATKTDITDEQYHEFRLETRKGQRGQREPDLMDEDPTIPLQRREDQGPVDPEFKGTVECLSHENKHIFSGN